MTHQNHLTKIILLLLLCYKWCIGMTVAPKSLESLISKGLLVKPRPNLYVLGTVHIGSKSAEEATLLIETVKPSRVVVEIPPSRFKRIKRTGSSDKPVARMDFVRAFGTFSDLGMAGFSNGGVSGFIFSVGILWFSLVKQALAVSQRDSLALPRRNEFEAAVVSAMVLNARLIPADLELETLIKNVASSMTLSSWGNLGLTVLKEAIHLEEPDPIKRQQGESMTDWEHRRRNISTARASRLHGERSCPELHKVMVEQRDVDFSHFCLDATNKDSDEVTVCIVGLVHLDGIVRRCREKE